ncbi:MAG: hypothetical protein KDC38_01070 [Planctomycetes bacterium]|nr:hypothetical protein [Planctomycetota bacterium]
MIHRPDALLRIALGFLAISAFSGGILLAQPGPYLDVGSARGPFDQPLTVGLVFYNETGGTFADLSFDLVHGDQVQVDGWTEAAGLIALDPDVALVQLSAESLTVEIVPSLAGTSGIPPGVHPLYDVSFSASAPAAITLSIENGILTLASGPGFELVGAGGSLTFLPWFVRGDCNGDGVFDLGDPIFHLQQLFQTGEDFDCPESCDVNDSGALDIADAIFAISGLYAFGAPPPAPYPACGPDPSGDYDCTTFASCP